MYLSQTAEYALRAIVHLADGSESPRTVQEIAARTRVSPEYLSKVLQGLRKGGLGRSRRGVNGGFVLARSPEEITVLDVIDAVDPIERIRKCPLGIRGHGRKLCPLHRRLDEALAAVEESFASTTIAEMIGESRSGRGLCERGSPGGRRSGKRKVVRTS